MFTTEKCVLGERCVQIRVPHRNTRHFVLIINYQMYSYLQGPGPIVSEAERSKGMECFFKCVFRFHQGFVDISLLLPTIDFCLPCHRPCRCVDKARRRIPLLQPPLLRMGMWPDAAVDVPLQRWDADEYFDPDPEV